MESFLTRIETFIKSIKSHHVSFMATVSGITAIAQSKDDFVVLFGVIWGAKVYVLSKWFSAFCIGVAAGAPSIFNRVGAQRATDQPQTQENPGP